MFFYHLLTVYRDISHFDLLYYSNILQIFYEKSRSKLKFSILILILTVMIIKQAVIVYPGDLKVFSSFMQNLFNLLTLIKKSAKTSI
jgi:hypothetical protein